MTTHYNSLLVVLEQDIRDDDAEPLIAAIKQLRGVVDVKGNPASIESATAEARVRVELGKKLFDILYEK